MDAVEEGRVRSSVRTWRDGLLNLGFTNPMLRPRSTKSTIKIVRPSAAEIHEWVTGGEVCRIRALLPEPAPDAADGDGAVNGRGAVNGDGGTDLPSDGLDVSVDDPEPELAPYVLDTRRDPRSLSSALRTLLRRSSEQYLDRGLWTLYLALGTLTWTDETDRETASPLLLVPVQLDRLGRGLDPTLSLMDGDPIVNPALKLRLQDFEVELPSVEEVENGGLASLLSAVGRAVSEKPGWRVEGSAELSLFSFAKEAMYQDLKENEDAIVAHPVIRALATGRASAGTGDLYFEEISESAMDITAAPEENPLVLDADASQRACVAAAVDGRSFVLDGPPGAGKSQTIANMIAALLHAGKSVLFVSEKAAALDVVRNRLTEVRLDSYLLELHSAKASRQEVSAALGRTLANTVRAPEPLPPAERERARTSRERLTGYAEAMNRTREPLGRSVHQVLGALAQLGEMPLAPSSVRSVERVSASTFAEVLDAAAGLARSWRPAELGESFVWRQVREVRPMAATTEDALRAFEGLSRVMAVYPAPAQALDLAAPSQAYQLATVLRCWSARPAGVPDSWLTTRSLADVRSTAKELEVDLAEIARRENEVSRVAATPWNVLSEKLSPADPTRQAFAELPALAVAPIRLDSLTPGEILRLRESLSADAQMLETRLGSLADIAYLLGYRDPNITSFEQADEVLTFADLAERGARPERGWLSAGGYEDACIVREALRSAVSDLESAERAAVPYFTPAVLDADVEGLSRRFAEVHHGMRKLLGSSRADRKVLAGLVAPGRSVREAIDHLSLAVRWKAAATRLAEVDAVHATSLGSYHAGRETDFAHLAAALERARAALHRADRLDLGRLAEVIARDAPPNDGLLDAVRQTRRDLRHWYGRLAPAPAAAMRPQLRSDGLAEAAHWARAQLPALGVAADFTQQVGDAIGRVVTLEEARSLVGLRRAVDDATAGLADRSPTFPSILGDGLYRGRDTDLKAVWEALAWAGQLRDEATADQDVLSGEQLAALRQGEPYEPEALAAAAIRWDEAKTALIAGFGEPRADRLASELDDPAAARQLLQTLQADPDGQQEWLSHQDARRTLERCGLAETVAFCVDPANQINAEQVGPVIEGAFLRSWVDHHLLTDPGFAYIRSVDCDALVEEYRHLDRKLIRAAVSDIVTACNARRPRLDIVGGAAVIRREAEKKRKHLPVRRLLEQAGPVVHTLKPCFMMSPLAVSQFLPADMRFDVTIFDEASQVSPGDAVNCIYRGRAFVAAGDPRQLPPSNFFAATSDMEEWDGEGDDDVGDFESILDLARGSAQIRSLQLRWHYRSRHESLIAFSNASFYESNLVTFPSAWVGGSDVGVELFHVPDGVYHRGRGRDNPVEARKVAERVVHHFTHRPGMTLGVIAFSQAQADAVATEVERVRAGHPELERFFTEDRLDGFFVKNLESVQGDERDVMIFSVGYGPDDAGKFHTGSLGPLLRQGGWRRLNVAVTRARYRNEIVSSIRAADLVSDRESVGHLRRYLDFAERGLAALGLGRGPAGDTETPLEGSVMAAIRSWGYDVTPQVGAAGYRVDIGVQHPERPGVYLLGVECDGRQYHSAKTARDRDRLRAQILTGLGWRLHRVWGTAWYRDRVGAEKQLRETLENTLAAPGTDVFTQAVTWQPEPAPPLEMAAEEPAQTAAGAGVSVQPGDVAATPAWAEPYQLAVVQGRSRDYELGEPLNVGIIAKDIRDIVAAEGPIHLDLLYQRLRELWRTERIGVRIRANIDRAITRAGVGRDGEFLLAHDAELTMVRTWTDQCQRKVSHVYHGELALAVTNTVRDSGGISEGDLLSYIQTEIFGWRRRGTEIANRLREVIDVLVSGDQLVRNANGFLGGVPTSSSAGSAPSR
ncbi:DUF3320 domain-containing protein [Frankia sp. Cpl3]|nr:DUF3320 domain-containing protein [Frankia sp. Cpl3]